MLHVNASGTTWLPNLQLMKVARFVMNEITQVMIMISGSVAPLPLPMFDYMLVQKKNVWLYAGQKTNVWLYVGQKNQCLTICL